MHELTNAKTLLVKMKTKALDCEYKLFRKLYFEAIPVILSKAGRVFSTNSLVSDILKSSNAAWLVPSRMVSRCRLLVDLGTFYVVDAPDKSHLSLSVTSFIHSMVTNFRDQFCHLADDSDPFRLGVLKTTSEVGSGCSTALEPGRCDEEVINSNPDGYRAFISPLNVSISISQLNVLKQVPEGDITLLTLK